MENEELPTLRRFAEIGREKLNFTSEDYRKMHYAFRKLAVLRKCYLPSEIKQSSIAFDKNREALGEKMNWINDYMKLKGFDEKVFRDITNYEISSEDYDYYYELKTPKQLKEEEEARKKSEEEISR